MDSGKRAGRTWQFLRRGVYYDTSDSRLYDMVINTGSVSLDAAAEMIVFECGRRCGG